MLFRLSQCAQPASFLRFPSPCRFKFDREGPLMQASPSLGHFASTFRLDTLLRGTHLTVQEPEIVIKSRAAAEALGYLTDYGPAPRGFD